MIPWALTRRSNCFDFLFAIWTSNPVNLVSKFSWCRAFTRLFVNAHSYLKLFEKPVSSLLGVVGVSLLRIPHFTLLPSVSSCLGVCSLPPTFIKSKKGRSPITGNSSGTQMGKFPIFAEGRQPHFYFWAIALQIVFQNLWEKLCKQNMHWTLLFSSPESENGQWSVLFMSQDWRLTKDCQVATTLCLGSWSSPIEAIVAPALDLDKACHCCRHSVKMRFSLLTCLQLFFKFKFWEHVRALLVHCPRVKSFKGSGQKKILLAKLSSGVRGS